MGISYFVYQHNPYDQDHETSTYLLKPFPAFAVHRLQNKSISVKAGYLYPGIYPGITIYTNSN